MIISKFLFLQAFSLFLLNWKYFSILVSSHFCFQSLCKRFSLGRDCIANWPRAEVSMSC
uniref:Uncharacterized protein n=1 Tax=Rhizophora mucronata TaxID=61149 RepID=A0A2P2QZ32_RHIMU